MEMASELQQLGICAVLPTYNNAGTLAQVIEGLMPYTSSILVVNDGSTDKTMEVLEHFAARIETISYPKNRGKGYALQQGFRLAWEKGFKYVLTMDTDGQHQAEDIVSFIAEIKRESGALIVGSRLLKQRHMPEGNTFANRFSNFWFWVQTGIRFPDTQSGFRLYPLEPVQRMRIFTKRYECELEILVRLAWEGIPLKAVPVNVFYAPPGERVTHFRPFRDFVRISMLNTVLVGGAILYGYPKRLYRLIQKKRQ